MTLMSQITASSLLCSCPKLNSTQGNGDFERRTKPLVGLRGRGQPHPENGVLFPEFTEGTDLSVARGTYHPPQHPAQSHNTRTHQVIPQLPAGHTQPRTACPAVTALGPLGSQGCSQPCYWGQPCLVPKGRFLQNHTLIHKATRWDMDVLYREGEPRSSHPVTSSNYQLCLPPQTGSTGAPKCQIHAHRSQEGKQEGLRTSGRQGASSTAQNQGQNHSLTWDQPTSSARTFWRKESNMDSLFASHLSSAPCPRGPWSPASPRPEGF